MSDKLPDLLSYALPFLWSTFLSSPTNAFPALTYSYCALLREACFTFRDGVSAAYLTWLVKQMFNSFVSHGFLL